MKLALDKKTIKETAKCHRGFICLTDKGQAYCKVEECTAGSVLFVKGLEKELCNYKMFIGPLLACNCPTRKEINKKYKL